MKLNSAQQVQQTLGQFEARVIPDEDPVIAQLNEPVAPEFRNILPDELFQTVEKLFRSSRHVFSHATLSTCHACLISGDYWDQRQLGPTTYLTSDPAFRDALQRRQ